MAEGKSSKSDKDDNKDSKKSSKDSKDKEKERKRSRSRDKEREKERDRDREKRSEKDREKKETEKKSEKERPRKDEKESEKKSDRDRDREKERERSRPRKDEKKSEREKDRDREKGRDRDRATGKDAERELERERVRQLKMAQEVEEEKKRAIDDATRADRTIMIAALPVKADERDVFDFFIKKNLKVRDVQIIRDSRTGRSKGIGYVEMNSQEFALKALNFNGEQIRGHTVTIQPSHAEKNRADDQGPSLRGRGANMQGNAGAASEPPLLLFVGGLAGPLAGASAETWAGNRHDLIRQLFQKFGDIGSVDVNVGFAFVQFKRASDGKAAIAAMNNYTFKGQPLQVGVATNDSRLPGIPPPPQLMAPLPPPMLPAALEDLGSPSEFLVLHRAFKPSEVDLKADPDFYAELEEEIEEECKKHGKTKKVHADRKSTQGSVWIQFAKEDSAIKCRTSMDKRVFDGQQIQARFATQKQFSEGRGGL